MYLFSMVIHGVARLRQYRARIVNYLRRAGIRTALDGDDVC